MMRVDTIHNIKCYPTYFNQVGEGLKTWELRRNDRDYHEGDILILNEYHEFDGHTGRIIVTRIVKIHHLYNLMRILSIDVDDLKGWVILTIKVME